ncbi:MAG: glycosyltransferase [Clostridia bacterium]|nr:glycosyltransferase [Clostridia bacterium]
MGEFILNAILWTLALYGAFEIIKTIINIYTYTNLKSDGIYVIIAVKNQENKIEGFLRNFLFRIIYGKEESIKDIIIADLDSTDETVEILNKLANDYEGLKVTNWRECKEVIESIKNV